MDKEAIRRLPRDERIDVVRRQYTSGLLERWVDAHHKPDAPTLYLPQYGGDCSPRQILVAVREGTPLGKDLTKFLFETSKRAKEPVSNFIERAIIANQGLN